jgi:hypothetical protein
MAHPLAAAVLALLLTGAAAGCHAQPPQAPPEFVTERVALRLGDSEVTLEAHTAGEGPAFLVLHDSEDTAVAAGLEILRARGGRLVDLLAGGERFVAFAWQGRTWFFDPNRIFTDAGAEATLRAQNGNAPPEVLAEVRRFAEAVLAAHGAGALRLLVTLHNNTGGDYSAADYAPGGSRAGAAAAVHLPAAADPDDFFFVTDRRLFDALAAEGFSVVLQNNEQATDDGSLSVWAARRGIPYVNVEAEHGHREQQVRMLEALVRSLT